MYNCIFTSHCTEGFCDKSCPILAETSYLLERNAIDFHNDIFKSKPEDIKRTMEVLNKSIDKFSVYTVPVNQDTVRCADLLTYCAICRFWKNSRLHCTVYNLKYSKYLDTVKKSWGLKSEPEDLEYMKIWIGSAKVLIVSNFDYINFGDFESQTLLNIIQQRQQSGYTTIFVSPSINMLVSSKSSQFFSILKTKMIEAAKVVK